MLDKIRKYIKLNNMLADGDSVVVGVSGGADSMCLLSVLIELGFDVKVVHINHMIRGIDADEDMRYVEKFCMDRGIKCFSFSYDVESIAKEKKLSCEEAGRWLRYETFYKVMKENACAKIAVAHNAGDNAETILHNLFRGTGIKGLVGILPKRDEIIRPLLCVSRDEIEAYLKDKNITYRIDATNFQDVYTRNKIRNTVLSYAKDNINKNVVEHITHTGQMLGEIDDFVSAEGDKAYEKFVSLGDGKACIGIEGFLDLHPVIKKYIIRKGILSITDSLKDITFTHIANVLELFSNEISKSTHLPYEIVARRTYDEVVLEKVIQGDSSNEEEAKICVKIDSYGEFSLGLNGEKLLVTKCLLSDWERIENKYEEKIYTKWLDCDILDRNLVIRTRRTGDYIVVDDKGSRKKIKALFIDLKIPKEQRDKVLLLADGSEIVWIIGHRINYNFRITKDTKEIIRLEYMK